MAAQAGRWRLTMRIERGDFVAVVGPSGCGKSTLMKLVTGLHVPQEGTVIVAGHQVTKPVSIVGMAFQNPTMLPWRTTLENVLLPLEIVEKHRHRLRAHKKEYVEKAEHLLETVGLKGFGEKFPWQLSGGMQQRANLCRALIHEPELLMLDEPFGALDAFTREELWCVIRDLHAARDVTIVLVTHDLRESVFLADKVLVMSARPGRVVAEHEVPFTRPRQLDILYDKAFNDMVQALHGEIATARAESATANATLPPPKSFNINWLVLAPWLYTIALFVVWEVVVRSMGISQTILPAPSRIAEAIVQYWSPIWKNSLQTLYTTVLGFLIAVIAGLGLGLFIGWSKAIYAGLYPIMIGFNAIPKVALVPILVIWFGIGTVPAVLTAFLISFFPIVVNVATGLATIEPETEDVLRALGAKKLDIMLKVGIPRSMPYFFGSLKIAITLAFVGSVVSETVASNSGLGNMMSSAQSQFNVPLVFAGLMMLAVEGIAMYALMAWIEKRMTGWAHRSTMAH